MKPKIQIEVEPLSESRWNKIEAGLFAEPEPELDGAKREPAAPKAARPLFRRGVVMGAVGFAAAAALAAVAGRTLFETAPAPALEASRIVTGTVPSHVALGTASIDVAPESAVVASGSDQQGLLVVLEKGSVDCEVAPRKGRPPFVVLAGDVRVRVVGTRFVVARAAEGVTVSVDHGAVEVTRGSEVKMLHDGERWSEVKTAHLPEPASSNAAPGTVDAAETTRPAGKTPATSGSHASPGNTDQKAFERAAALEVKDPETAMATYRRLGSGAGAWSGPSLYAAGRLAADRGRTAEAKALLGQYVSRFPNGANAADAQRLLRELR